MATGFKSEAAFEDAVVDQLQRYGWGEVLHRPTEQQLIDNWAKILFENNRSIDRLGDVPLTDGEMAQIMEQVTALRTPLRLNEFINGRTVAIRRDAPEAMNFDKEISLKIYDRLEIAGGQSRYQIARQPKYPTVDPIVPDRRGDLMLLINGMPVIHIELKRSGVPVSQAYNQIEKYAFEGVYLGLFSLVQVFVAMTPEESRYFANPGPDGRFNPDFYFKWADFNNEPVNEWAAVVQGLLSIPMAHQLVGFYTVADRAAGTLMVMRSYQYYAASRIADRVTKKAWGDGDQRGGYVWHTTGSGKTITSFKTAQLIADSRDADKVVFLLDRIELGSQSLENYRSYGGEAIDVGATEDTHGLVSCLTDDETVLVVTSIQKMGRVNEKHGVGGHDLGVIRDKRVVFIVDEAHRSTFGEMLEDIRQALPDALFFGFTGTPIHEENRKQVASGGGAPSGIAPVYADTKTIFGNELHRYSIADGINDGNVLGFDPVMVETFPSHELRRQVALYKAKAKDEAEAFADPAKKKVFNKYMDKGQVPMIGKVDASGREVQGIEDLVPQAQYDADKHRRAVVDDITSNWVALSQNGKFHAILATSSIPEAIKYFRLFRDEHPDLAVTALFDANIGNDGADDADQDAPWQVKEQGLKDILVAYNERFGQSFTIPTHAAFKKDVAARLAHKDPYHLPDFTPDKQINLLIVVNQMLTGFDSKWLNTLYLDKKIEFESIIQAFSRTNRIFGPDKPFGSIRYYRYPHTMRHNIEEAVKLYSGDKPLGLFAPKLDAHLTTINECCDKIRKLFAGIEDFSRLPEDLADRGSFAKVFAELYHELQAARVQGFTWEQSTYKFTDPPRTIVVELTEPVFAALLSRYKDLAEEQDEGDGGGGGGAGEDVAFDIDTHISHIDTDLIDAEYLNAKFIKYVRALNANVPPEELKELLEEVHSGFALLSADDQVFANLWLHDVASGDAQLVDGKSVQDYVNDYKLSHQDRQIAVLTDTLGLDEKKLRALLDARVVENTIDEYGRFGTLVDSVNLDQAADYLERRTGERPSLFKVRMEVDALLRGFVLHDELPQDLEVNERSGEGGDA